VKKRVILRKSGEPAPRNDVDELLEGIRRALARSDRRNYAIEERERILEVEC
jgi:hypothetical protein